MYKLNKSYLYIVNNKTHRLLDRKLYKLPITQKIEHKFFHTMEDMLNNHYDFIERFFMRRKL